MLSLIGLGLCDGNDISVRGKEALAGAHAVYIESYTSLLQCSHDELEAQLGTSITKLSRQDVEQDIDGILQEALEHDIVILIVGDVFAATTHADLYLRARKLGVVVRTIHNASIMNAIGSVGLELYRYGKTVSIPYWEKGFEPTSFLEGIKDNHDRGLHTLCLLDIKADQDRFMTVREGIEHLEKADAELGLGLITPVLPLVGVARIGWPEQTIRTGMLRDLREVDFGASPHAIVVPGKLHPIEEEMLQLWGI